ncbi:RNA polymerase sigma-70 factor [Amycolatopsis acidicola]|uniref:RNA polymerase sigma-70 factor n=1 Tax=Amycolatopsis acidicola TaxID=2596893 RepID=UPI002442FECF|nr:RNA polymerase sigma-70 factor [Amycolatopsis acidicola]
MSTRSAEEFEAYRGRLFGLAYRMLGSAHEAEDIVQETFLRWEKADRASIAAPAGWLVKVATNLCLNQLDSARVRREAYRGPWLPEPVLTADGALGPLELAEQRDSVSFALLVLAERLSPAERAVFVLREAFSYSHGEIAAILDRSEASCRQLYHRARARLAELPETVPPPDNEIRELVERFLAAAREGDVAGLEELLTEDVTSWADGGGQVPVAGRPVSGRLAVARYLAGTITKYGASLETSFAEVNGTTAVLAWAGPELSGVLVPEFDGGRIRALRIVAGPGKLAFARAQAGGLSHPGGPSGS